MKKILLLTLSLLSFTKIYSQEIIPLWGEQIPNQKVTQEKETSVEKTIIWIENIQKPTLEIYLPSKKIATGKAVVICPGGGYRGLAYDGEGTDIAKWFNSKGIAAFVLKYRVPASKSLIIPHEAPLQDAKRAMRLVRSNAKKWNINENQIGIMGFSAGGHLASTLGTHFDSEDKLSKSDIENISARPDFMILIYPVITMEAFGHQGSRENLLGMKPSQELLKYYSNEIQVTGKTPPTFLLHCSDDKTVPVKNSLVFYEALQKEKVESEMHIFPKGGHGFGLAIGKGHLENWTDNLYEWILSLK
ncbi:alpha/beta hydrolase [Chryseobacterium sp.]|uniref:alpha/beta hydrolase n=1 Tax=Chryseobacterium sp. TaxID=1871047 RepID=UPI0028A0B6BD|nr:alpha/beta hydrolase [Chryseobacterium sp.]